jgi:16S rRNA (guanine966-N2)-methyltransferase
LRIISGKFKGKLLNAPVDLPVRPTTDFAKTGLFNLLDNRVSFEDLSALDLFSGIASISLELISRGCKTVHSVENNRGCVAFQREIAKKWNVPELLIHQENVFSFLKKNATLSFPMIFADPPYDLKEAFAIPGMVFENLWLEPEGWLIMEHNGSHDWKKNQGYLFTRNYGKVHFSFFQNNQ